MAGEWMKIELALPDKPEVHYIAGVLSIDPDAVVGKLIRVWSWFDKHTEDGNALGVTISLLDRLTNVTGFGEAMMLAGWIEQHDKTLHMPKFDSHTSESSKKRALTAKRVAKIRNANVTPAALPREEKRREDKNTSASVPENGFAKFWEVYPRKKSKGDAEKAWGKIKPDELLTERIFAAVMRAKTSADWQKESGKFIPYPASWLNSKGWDDEGTEATVSPLRLAV